MNFPPTLHVFFPKSSFCLFLIFSYLLQVFEGKKEKKEGKGWPERQEIILRAVIQERLQACFFSSCPGPGTHYHHFTLGQSDRVRPTHFTERRNCQY